ncbi:MAG: hypothetical protein EB084_10965 [Proteobacteria bacterium]|nr:hypothetical protein [Pseudomonadota bacterium]
MARFPEEIGELVATLRAHQQELVLPVRQGKPLLVLAVESGRSPQALRAMLRCGVPLDQEDLAGKTALDRVVEQSVRGFGDALDLRHRRLLADSAICLLSHGARAPRPDIVAGRGNEAARCAAEYHDALASAIVQRAALAGDLPACGHLIASFVA